MFKFSIKFNNSNPTIFWQRAIIIFAVGLVLVFVGQAIILFIVNDSTPTIATDQTSQIIRGRQERQAVNALIDELFSRPNRLNEILATTTVLVDPSR